MFVTDDGEIDAKCADEAIRGVAEESDKPPQTMPDPAAAFAAAKQHLEVTANLWGWTEDVEFIAMSRVVFVRA